MSVGEGEANLVYELTEAERNCKTLSRRLAELQVEFRRMAPREVMMARDLVVVCISPGGKGVSRRSISAEDAPVLVGLDLESRVQMSFSGYNVRFQTSMSELAMNAEGHWGFSVMVKKSVARTYLNGSVCVYTLTSAKQGGDQELVMRTLHQRLSPRIDRVMSWAGNLNTHYTARENVIRLENALRLCKQDAPVVIANMH